MNHSQARAIAAEILQSEGIGAGNGLQGDLIRLSRHLQMLLPEMSDEWAVVQGQDTRGRAQTPAVLAVGEAGVVWQIRVEGRKGGGSGWSIAIAVLQPQEWGLLIEREALAGKSPDRRQRLWRALAREKLGYPHAFAPNRAS